MDDKLQINGMQINGTRDGSIIRDFGDGEYTFRLAWKQLIELQEKCGCGPANILNRLVSGNWLMEDIREVIRIGLIGGGTSPGDALRLVRTYVEERPSDIAGNHGLLMTALQVLAAAIAGVPDEPLGENQAPVLNESTTSPTGRSESEPSTPQVP